MEEQRRSYAIPVGIPIFILVVLLFWVLVFWQKNSSTTVPSTFSLTPSPSSAVPSEEPVITSWQPYQNTTYNFSLQVPADWKSQDYSSFYQQGGTVIAFSPTDLPCGSCTYVHDGFMSVHIYNAKTDAISYSNYQQHLKQAQNSKDVAKVNVGANNGILAGNSVAVEHGDWVYEFVLDTNNGNDQAISSKIFQRIVTSLQFTDLKFSP